MKELGLAILVSIMLAVPGWAENTSREQAKAGAAAHREEARNNPERPHHRRKHHWRHHRHHNGT
jgi:hypothetical protein